MHILQIITSANWGGAQRHVLDLSQGIKEAGHDVTVLYGDPGLLTGRLEALGISVIRVPELTRQWALFQDARAIMRIRRLIQRFNPDIVHVHSSKAGALVRISCLGLGLPVVYTVHGLVYQNATMSQWKRRFYRQLETTLLPYTRAVIVVARRDQLALQDIARRHGPSIYYIPNGIDAPSTLASLPDEPTVGTVARFTEEKGLEYLLEAFTEVSRQFPKAQLLLVGDGPLRDSLEREVQRCGIGTAVEFAGFHEDPGPFLAHMRIFVLSSVKEGAPYTVLEAMAAHRLIVATDVGDVAYILRDYPGTMKWVVPPADPKALAAAIGQALDANSDPRNLTDWTHTRMAMIKATLLVYQTVEF